MDIEQLLAAAKTNKKILGFLKQAAVHAQNYDMAAQFREMEQIWFPKTDSEKEADRLSKEISSVFRLAGIETPDSVSWFIYQICMEFSKKGTQISTDDILGIKYKKDQIFGQD